MTRENNTDLMEESHELMDSIQTLCELAQITPSGFSGDNVPSNSHLIKMVSDRVTNASIAYMSKSHKLIERLQEALIT